MNKNKGIIGIGLILAIVIGVAVVGGGAYYLGKNKVNVNFEKTPENILPVLNEEQNLPVVDDTKKASIIVLSPNGGEVYNDSDKINVKWKGVWKDKIAIYLRFSDGDWCFVKGVSSSTTNYVFTPHGYNCTNKKIITNGQYKITIISYENSGMAPEPGTAFATSYSDGNDGYFDIDSSDNYFTINSKKTVLTTLPQYVGSHSDCGGSSQCWPPAITTSLESYSCNNIGVVPHTEGNEINEQRIINGRAYCIYSISSGYAGGRGYTYTYMIPNGKGTKLAKFGFVYPSCGVWQGDGTSKFSDCKNNQSNFSANLDNLIDSLMQAN